LLHRDGSLQISDSGLAKEPGRVLRLGVFDQALDAADPFLHYKTTRRPVHEAASTATTTAGLDEMILFKRSGRVGDGARSSLFVEREGRLLTPPISAGALPGVLRAELIDQGVTLEAELSLDDFRIGPVFVGNSLRGLRRYAFG